MLSPGGGSLWEGAADVPAAAARGPGPPHHQGGRYRLSKDSVSPAQVLVAAYFSLLVVLWFFQEPEFIPGWSDHFGPGMVGEATPAALVLVLLFITPANFNFWPFRAKV